MRHLALASAAFILVASFAGASRAGDEPAPGTPEAKKRAEELLAEANKHWADKDPAECKKAAERALELDPTHVPTLGFLGSLYEIKIGDLDMALKYYDDTIKSLVGATEQKEKRYKADIMARKANLLYSHKDDLDGAKEVYKASLDTYQLSSTADKLSNLAHKIAGTQSDPAKTKEEAEFALKCSQLALDLAPYSNLKGDKQKHWVAKVRVQLAVCLEALGRKDEAEKALATVDFQDYDDSCLYNLALLDAIHKDGKKAADRLHDFLKNTRPTARSRNTLRKSIRTEPDFKPFLHDPAWQDLVTDEPEESGKGK